MQNSPIRYTTCVILLRWKREGGTKRVSKIIAVNTSVTHWCSAASLACLAERSSRFCLSISSERKYTDATLSKREGDAEESVT